MGTSRQSAVTKRTSALTLSIVALAYLVLAVIPAAAVGQSYIFQTIDVPGAYPSSAVPWAINDSGRIVGQYLDTS